MTRQMFLHEPLTPNAHKPPSRIKILNWNVRNPSIERAKQQADWIIQTHANIIILTEAKNSGGCLFIRDWLESYGFDIFVPHPKRNDYCVMVATKGFSSQRLEVTVNFLPHRLMSIRCETILGVVEVVGLYVPSRGPTEKRNVDKRKFQDQISGLLQIFTDTTDAGNLIIGGDLNVVERNHVPYHPVFGEWEYEFYDAFLKSGLTDAYRWLYPHAKEYSWFGRQGDGYRLDHFFVSSKLRQQIVDCFYIHTTRDLNLSDHSAMYLEVAQDSVRSGSLEGPN